MDPVSVISSAHPSYIDSLYKDYLQNPESVEQEWRSFFQGFDLGVRSSGKNGAEVVVGPKDFKVWALIDAYRRKGHLISDTNPIRPRKNRNARLELHHFGLSDQDLDQKFLAGSAIGLENASLKEILDKLKKIYCASIGVQYMYITDDEPREWFREYYEKNAADIQLSIKEKKRILEKLNESVVFEEFLSKKYIGQKRFSLEGGETTIPALDTIINATAEGGVKEVVLGMAHRGRLNVLVNLLGKTYEQIFTEFEGTSDPDLTMGDGDVKYHLGYSSEIKTPSGKEVNLKLSPNPSHLEAVDPVVAGFSRAKADILYDSDFKCILPILIHGDAALAGQGVVYELLQMSQLKGYQTGGTIHFVINNQIGFTTDYEDARSSHYCTSYAATVHAPVIHVNGDDAEAVVFAAKLAAEFRQKFHRDVFIDMVCYRKHGHNEGDDPKFTQPNLYELIGKHPNPRQIYIKKLVSSGHIEAELAQNMEKEFRKLLQARLEMVKEKPLPYKYQEPELAWKALRKSEPEDFEVSPTTAISLKTAEHIIKKLHADPENFDTLRKISKMMGQKLKMYEKEQLLDWEMGETLAYGSLLLEGHDIRMSGQDTKRGTFSHRHSVFHDENSGEEFNRLNNIKEGQKGMFRVYNSLLSEFAVLGFEYGYSTASPNTLTIWEAQFGDFSNGAQTIIDQFITSGESKWQRMSGVTLLLPHGYEGQGPEHSSARLERFLQMSAEFNISVANCTTPANFFHILRRQLHWPFRKPLVVMSPKSLLRHPKCVSPIEEFTTDGFREIILNDFSEGTPDKVKKVLFCSGKIYYDLIERQEKEQCDDMIICRLEQLYPLPFKQIDNIMKKYKNAKKIWIQEEPANMGAWVYMLSCYRKVNWELISRKSSASPASGFHKIHAKEQEEILNRAFSKK